MPWNGAARIGDWGWGWGHPHRELGTGVGEAVEGGPGLGGIGLPSEGLGGRGQTFLMNRMRMQENNEGAEGGWGTPLNRI